MLSARDVVKSYADCRVLSGVSVSVAPGHRLGLVGENGAGKSTLLRLLAGTEDPDSGQLTRPADVGFLHQETPYTAAARVETVIEDALVRLRGLEHEVATAATALSRHPGDDALATGYAAVLQAAEAHSVWDADRRAALTLAGLGLDRIDRGRRLGSLSGGERSRLMLAALLIRRPTALLLDEPTNHLDDNGIAFLEARLRELPGAVVVASHDRVFLDEVCTGIYDLDPARGGSTFYGGAYRHYLREKRIERQNWQYQWRTEQEQLRVLRLSVAQTAREVGKFRPIKDKNKMAYDRRGEHVQRQISRRVRNAVHRLDELTRDQMLRPPDPLRLDAAMTTVPVEADRALVLRGVTVPGRLVLDRLDLPAAGRLLVTGPNGAGKSTLLEVLAGRLTPARGRVERAAGVRVALLEQDVTFPQPQHSPRALYESAATGKGVPNLVDLGLVAPRDLDRPVGLLSTGQRRRLALALLVALGPNVLLLDEPTNHLSLTLADELEDALGTTPGAVVVATHDRWLRRRWSGPELRLGSTALRTALASGT
jgi:macrolide transport system ATP-binding/permease protein